MYMQKFQLKGERFGGGGGYFGRGRRGGFRGSLSRQGDTCYKCGATGHWAINCPGRGETQTRGQTSVDELFAVVAQAGVPTWMLCMFLLLNIFGC